MIPMIMGSLVLLEAAASICSCEPKAVERL